MAENGRQTTITSSCVICDLDIRVLHQVIQTRYLLHNTSSTPRTLFFVLRLYSFDEAIANPTIAMLIRALALYVQ